MKRLVFGDEVLDRDERSVKCEGVKEESRVSFVVLSMFSIHLTDFCDRIVPFLAYHTLPRLVSLQNVLRSSSVLRVQTLMLGTLPALSVR